jgi:23S rRNA (cytidine1920-2'-O)/16S rRNA (cytidine1409-2'-O)-methyltransferase
VSKDRADKIIQDLGLVETRSQAKMLIEKGDVTCNGKVISKPGQKVSRDDSFEIAGGKTYVSRGAYKLLKALDEFHVNLKDKTIADVGASTGGFTQVCLELGACKVYCIDVGTDQLHEKVKSDSRVINLEKTNIKDVKLPESVDICVVDLSFISTVSIVSYIKDLLGETGQIIALIKPQFEAGKERLGKGGLIKSDSLREEILNESLEGFKERGLTVKKVIDSPIEGKDGNKEYLALLIKN